MTISNCWQQYEKPLLTNMDSPNFTFIFLFIILIIVSGIIFLSYWIPKKMGYKKAGKIISGILIIGTIILSVSIYIDDYLFFKSDAIELLSEQNIELKYDFEIIENKSVGTVDYYHRFELLISESDKKRLLNEIKSSKSYQDSIKSYFHLPSTQDRYIGNSITVNYQTHTEFKSEFYEPNGKGYVPTYRIISIPKLENKLIFEEIVD